MIIQELTELREVTSKKNIKQAHDVLSFRLWCFKKKGRGANRENHNHLLSSFLGPDLFSLLKLKATFWQDGIKKPFIQIFHQGFAHWSDHYLKLILFKGLTKNVCGIGF